MSARIQHSQIAWLITTICIIITLATFYAFAPFLPISVPQITSRNPSLTLPYRSSSPLNISIQLPTRTLNPYTTLNEPKDDRLSAQHLNTADQTLYLIQFKDTNMPTNLSIITSFPTNTFLIRSTPSQLYQISRQSNVNFIDHYAPEYKLSEQLITNLPLQQDAVKNLNLQITIDPAQNTDRLFSQILTLDPQAQITNQSNTFTLPNYTLTISASSLIKLSQFPQIIAINPLNSEI